jgi:3-hydroxyacyl-CoA dehydrogenase
MPVPGILKSQEKHIMSLNKPVRRIAIVGTGVIGASWAAQYLASGFDVIATDPARVRKPAFATMLKKHGSAKY